MDIVADRELFWIAREGLKAPLPKDWKPCKTQDTEEIYYFNFSTGESTWDHPCDGYYRNMYEENKKKLAKEASSSKPKGKKENKKRDTRLNSSSLNDVPNKLDLKPLSLGSKVSNKPTITQQPLPRMGSLNEETNEPSGPPPLLDLKPTAKKDASKKKDDHQKPPSIKTMKDVESVISPRQLLRKSNKGSPPILLNQPDLVPGIHHADEKASKENAEGGGGGGGGGATPTSLANSLSSTSSTNSTSSGKLSKSKSFTSKKFARGLASALTNGNDMDDEEGDDAHTISSKATVLRETRVGLQDPNADE
jgi:hypothetical protein